MRYINQVRSTLSSPDFPVFNIRDLRIALSGGKISTAYVHLMVHNLMRKKEVTRITRGIYTFHKDVFVAGFAFEPFYYGMESALSIRGISEQGTNPIVVTSRNVRVGMRSFNGRNYRVSRIDPKLMFGYDTIKYGDLWLPVSGVEKTVIDMAYFRVQIRDELLPEIKKRLDKNKLESYLSKYAAGFRKRVYAALKIKT